MMEKEHLKKILNYIEIAYHTGTSPLEALGKLTKKSWTETHYDPDRPGFTRLSAEGETDIWIETPHSQHDAEVINMFKSLPVTTSEDNISLWLDVLGKDFNSTRPGTIKRFLELHYNGVTLTVKKQQVCDAEDGAIPGHVIYYKDQVIAVFTWNPKIKLTLVEPHELKQSQLAAV